MQDASWCIFDNLKVAKLKAFIIASLRKYTKLSDVAHLKNPRGGKMIDDASNGVDNCILVAFGSCNMKSCLVATMERQEEDTNVVDVISEPLTSRINLYGLSGEERKPSDILKDQAMVDLLVCTFNPNGKLNTLAYPKLSADMLKKANLLFVLFEGRFLTHVKWKVKPCQQSNRCLSWANKNLALVTAWMIVVCHHKEDISFLDESKCLLANLSGNKFLVCLNEELSYLGCYLHPNSNEHVWVQTGRATGKGGLGKHLQTHLERASSDRNDDNSHVKHSFPTKLSACSLMTKEGYYEHLTTFNGVGFLAEYPLVCFLEFGWAVDLHRGRGEVD